MENSNAKFKFQIIQNSLMPFCKRVASVGDLRRHCPDVERIEILAISRVVEVNPLFGRAVAPYPLVEDWVIDSGLRMEINRPEYKRLKWEGIDVDLFLTDEYRWGLQMALRTGCEGFTKWLVTNQRKGGALPENMSITGGWLCAGNKKLITMTEQNFFTCIETEWIRPSQRSEGNWRK